MFCDPNRVGTKGKVSSSQREDWLETQEAGEEARTGVRHSVDGVRRGKYQKTVRGKIRTVVGAEALDRFEGVWRARGLLRRG
jgi:hypothetical protein